MIKTLIFLVTVALLAGAAILLADQGGMVRLTIGDTLIEAELGAAVAGLILFALAVAGATRLWIYFLSLPQTIARRKEAARRAKGMTALTKGLTAVAAGDAEDAQRLAKAAERHLDERPLTRLLSAQAALIADDQPTVKQQYSAMLEAPETEFLALRGLYSHAEKSGDAKTALAHARRAFELRPSAAWAFGAVFDLQVQTGAWGEALATLDVGLRNGLLEKPAAKRRRAVLHAASAAGAEANGDNAAAKEQAALALKAAPGFTPAALIAARQAAAAGQKGEAERVLMKSWAAAPHPAIAGAFAALSADAAETARRLLKLADKAPAAPDSAALKAEQYMVLEDWPAARKALEPVLTAAPSAEALALLAEIEKRQTGEASAAEPWLARAVDAPRTSGDRDQSFAYTQEEWAALVYSYGETSEIAPAAADEKAPAALEGDTLLAALEGPKEAPEPEETTETADAAQEDDPDKPVNEVETPTEPPLDFAPPEPSETKAESAAKP